MKSVATARGDVNVQRSLVMGVPRKSCYSCNSAMESTPTPAEMAAGPAGRPRATDDCWPRIWTMCGDFRTRISSPIGLHEEPLHLQLVRNGDRSLHLLPTRDHRIARD